MISVGQHRGSSRPETPPTTQRLKRARISCTLHSAYDTRFVALAGDQGRLKQAAGRIGAPVLHC
jgi:hypothetical protein